MIKKIMRKLAENRLNAAVKHEEMLRESAEYMRKVVIPRHEKELREREIDCMVTERLKGLK